jgi:glucose/arabinose dehydrogenase
MVMKADEESRRRHRIGQPHHVLRGLDANGAAQSRSVYLQGLHSPFGMALVGNDLYVADTDAVLRFPYRKGASISGRRQGHGPAGRHHQPPLDQEHHRQPGRQVPVRDGRLQQQRGGKRHGGGNRPRRHLAAGTRHRKSRLFATGLRNANGMGWEPQTKALWTTVNERDELGNDLVPDYMTSVKEGGFYGWPYSYYGQHVDTRVSPQKPELVAKAIAPDYALGGHTASLGLVFYEAALFPQPTGRRVHRPARLVEPQAAQRLQGGVHSVQRRQAVRAAAGFPDRLPQPRRQGAGPAGGRGGRQAGRAAGGG